MKKVKATKKINYRMRRRIRRTMASVLLITSMIIAAIPVQDVAGAGVDPDDIQPTVSYPTNTEIAAAISANSAPSLYPKDPSQITGITSYSDVDTLAISTSWASGAEINTLYNVFEVYTIVSNDTRNGAGVVNGINTSYPPDNPNELIIPHYAPIEYYRFSLDDETDHVSNEVIVGVNTYFANGFASTFNDAIDPEDIKEFNGFMGIGSNNITNGDKFYNAEKARDGDTGDYYWRWFYSEKDENGEEVQDNVGSEIKIAFYMSQLFGLGENYGEYSAKDVYVAKEGTESISRLVPVTSAGEWVASKNTEITAISNYAFYEIPTNSTTYATTLGQYSNIVMYIEDSITSIGDNAFQGANLNEVMIGGKVTDIGNQAFKECGGLNLLSFGLGVETIGVEAFYGCNSLVEIVLPTSMKHVGIGAFAECTKLQTFNYAYANSDGVVLDDYVFFNCQALKTVELPSSMSSIGKGCFAISGVGGALEEIDLSVIKSGGTDVMLYDYMFQGQSNLKTVKMPTVFGTKGTGTHNATHLNLGFFKGCTSLEVVEFQDSSIYATFTKGVFVDVTTDVFRVSGPLCELNVAAIRGESPVNPRVSAHISNVPYQYTENGVDYIELKDGEIFYRINEDGELIHYESYETSGTIDVVIPAKVGEFVLTSIKSGCFDDVKDRVVSFTIEDGGAITTIEAGVFSGATNLLSVYIGDSVVEIGDNAFSYCTSLYEVSLGESLKKIGNEVFLECKDIEYMEFDSPKDGTYDLVIGTDAFKTYSTELTFRGDIVDGYAPFDYAMDPVNELSGQAGKRICYRSHAPYNLVVMYDNANKATTLIDYPHLSNIDVDNKEFKEWLEADFESRHQTGNLTYIKEMVSSDFYLEDTIRNAYYDNVLRGVDFGNKYGDMYGYGNGLYAWSTIHTETEKLYDSIVNIVIPSGIESIDAQAFYTSSSNTVNFYYVSDGTYMSSTVGTVDKVDLYSGSYVPPATISSTVSAKDTLEITSMVEVASTYATVTPSTVDIFKDVSGGLFSGHFTEDLSADVLDSNRIGNDRIKSITFNSVIELPDYAFAGCENLTTVILGDDMTDMGIAPFVGAISLANVYVNDAYETENDNFNITNKIVYKIESDGTYSLVECLPIRGEKDGTEWYVASKYGDPISNVSSIREAAFIGTEYLLSVDFQDSSMTSIPTDCFYGSGIVLAEFSDEVLDVASRAFYTTGVKLIVALPAEKVNIAHHTTTSEGSFFQGNQEVSLRGPEGGSGEIYASNYDNISFDKLTYYNVYFYGSDQITYLDSDKVLEGGLASVPFETIRNDAPTGQTFDYFKIFQKNSDDKLTLDEVFNIYSDGVYAELHCYAQYVDSGSYTVNVVNGTLDDTGLTEGTYTQGVEVSMTTNLEDFKEWTTTSAGVYFSDKTSETVQFIMPENDVTIIASNVSTGTSGDSSDGTDGEDGSDGADGEDGEDGADGSTSGQYTVTVVNGSGSGDYDAGEIINIMAYASTSGLDFDEWTTSTAGVYLANDQSVATSFVMPSFDVAVSATYGTSSSDGSGSDSDSDSSGNNNTTTNPDGGTTLLTITKPGFSNTDVASAYVNGSADNFVVKITESAAATEAMKNAFIADMGSLESIKMFPMDISLYDETGTVKVTDTLGITVTITIPIPDELVEYAGNNKAAAEDDGKLDKLGVKFSTINGVSCITFEATHFSPYAVYVEVDNLTEGTLDENPKTGDGVHPKWFLSLGFFASSLFLFLKKDKREKVKLA